MKSLFLVFLLIFASVFTTVTPNPLVEIIEEHRVIQAHETVLPVVLESGTEAENEFPPPLTLTPQFHPHPQLKPPSYS